MRELGTPLFVYDEDQLRRRCREAVADWGSGVAYASKAFLCRAMAQLADDEGMMIDVSTGGELHVALAAGVPAERLVLHGNNKSDAELGRALEVGVGRIVVDSFDEIDRLVRLAPEAAIRPAVLVRVTPGIEAHTHEYVMTGQDDSKFGFGLASGAAPRRWPACAGPRVGVDLVGVHAHIGSQIFSAGSFEKAVAVMAAFFSPWDSPSCASAVVWACRTSTGETAPSIAEWADTVRAAAAGGRARIGVAPHRRAGPGHRGRRRHHLLHGRDHQGVARAFAPTSASMAG